MYQDIDFITASDIAEKPELLDRLKSLAKDGHKVSLVKDSKKTSFVAEHFNEPSDFDKVLEHLDLTPAVDLNLNLYFTNKDGANYQPDDVLDKIRYSDRAHYLKEVKAIEVKAPEQNTPNPYKTGNRTQQYLLERKDPKRAALLKKAALV